MVGWYYGYLKWKYHNRRPATNLYVYELRSGARVGRRPIHSTHSIPSSPLILNAGYTMRPWEIFGRLSLSSPRREYYRVLQDERGAIRGCNFKPGRALYEPLWDNALHKCIIQQQPLCFLVGNAQVALLAKHSREISEFICL